MLLVVARGCRHSLAISLHHSLTKDPGQGLQTRIGLGLGAGGKEQGGAGLCWSHSSPCACHPHLDRWLPPAPAPLYGEAQHLLRGWHGAQSIAPSWRRGLQAAAGAWAHGQVQAAAHRKEGPVAPQAHFLPLGVRSPQAQPRQPTLSKLNLALCPPLAASV